MHTSVPLNIFYTKQHKYQNWCNQIYVKLRNLADRLVSTVRNITHPSLKFAWAQIAEGENNDQELLQSQVGQE